MQQSICGQSRASINLLTAQNAGCVDRRTAGSTLYFMPNNTFLLDTAEKCNALGYNYIQSL